MCVCLCVYSSQIQTMRKCQGGVTRAQDAGGMSMGLCLLVHLDTMQASVCVRARVCTRVWDVANTVEEYISALGCSAEEPT